MTQKTTVTRAHSAPASRFCALFGGARANGYKPDTMRKCDDGKMRPEAHRWVNKCPTVDLWRQHLVGELGLGILPPGENSKVLFGALDVDDYDLNPLKTAEQIHRQKLPLVPVHTKSGGHRLFLFATEPVEEELMKRALRALSTRLDIRLKEEGGKTEIITTANIWMPYCGGDNAECFAFNRTGGAMTVGEFLGDADAKRQSPAAVWELAKVKAKSKSGATGGAGYAAQELRRYCADLGKMADTEGRNNYLNNAFFQMARMIAAGWIDRGTVEHELQKVADAIGMDKTKTEDMIGRRNGPIAKGMLEPPPDLARPKSQVPTLLQIARDAELFHTPDGTGCADLIIDGHRETCAIKSPSFRRWLLRRYFETTDGAPGTVALATVLATIDAQACYSGTQERRVSVRVAGHADKIYIDLADEEWRAVEIDADGWRVVDRPPVRFRRPNGVRPLPLPLPTRGGSVHDLRSILNLRADADFTLLVAWLLAALRPHGPYPVLAVAGETGAAKTSLVELLRTMLDPNTVKPRALPREDRDLFIAANNNYVLAFDNVSGLPLWISDTLCRLATGGGFATRQLHTDQEEVLFDAERPIILNGIEDFVNRPDLADRAIMLTLPPIAEEKCRTRQEIKSEFKAMHPAVLGALLDIAAHGLRKLPSIKLERMPRMADFAVWMAACEGALDLKVKFADAYSDNRSQAVTTIIEANPVAEAVRTFMSDKAEWTGTASQLLMELGQRTNDSVKRGRQWPGASHVLAGQLRRVAKFLRKEGIEFSRKREGRYSSKLINITNSDNKQQQELDLTKSNYDDEQPDNDEI
jgi:hypothetical protein